MAQQADLSNIEIPEPYTDISVERLQDVSEALHAADEAALLAAETGTDPKELRRLAVTSLLSEVSRTAIDAIMRITTVHPRIISTQLVAAATVADEVAKASQGRSEPEIQNVAEKAAQAAVESVSAATHINEVVDAAQQ